MSGRSVALRAWIQARPAEGTPVEIYLRNLGIAGPLPGSLRYEPPPTGPAVLAPVTTPDGRVAAVSRLPLTADGEKRGEAVVIGPLGDGAARVTALPACFSYLGIAATIEEAVAVARLWPGFPVWASLSGARLGHLWIPPAIQAVVLFIDANAASARLVEEAEAIYGARGKLTHIEYLGDRTVAA